MTINIFKNNTSIYYNEDVDAIEFSDNTLTLHFSCGRNRIFFKVEYDKIKINKK